MTQEMFTRELERRADRVHGAPFTFEDVRERARSIRRRRRIASTAAAAAAVVAIALPFALGGDDDRSGPDPAPSPPTSSPSAAGPQAPGSSVLHEKLLIHPDGRTTPLDLETTDLQQLGVLADGRVVVPVPGKRKIQVYGADGRLDTTYDVDLNVITASADDTLVAWIDADLHVVVLESGRAEPTTYDWKVPFSGENYGFVDAVSGSDCVDGGCMILVGDFNTTTYVLTKVDEPAAELNASEPLRVVDVSPDGRRWAVTFPPSDDSQQFGCSGLYDPVDRAVVARSCETTVESFSPDGQHLVGARGDNQMWGSLEVLDEDLEVVMTYESGADDVIKDWGWADPEHLLVATAGLRSEPAPASLLEVPIDGSEPEVVAGPVPGPNPDWSPAFQISE